MDDLISPAELHERRQTADPPTVIDVRGPEEYAEGHLPGALHIPADQLANNLDAIRRDRPVVTY